MTDAQIFQVFGIGLFVMGVSWISNPRGFQYLLKDLTRNSGVLFLTGMMTFAAGYLIVSVHTTTSPLMMMLGWLTLLKGLIILMFASAHVALYPFLSRLRVYHAIVPWLVTVVGLIALYLGYLA